MFLVRATSLALHTGKSIRLINTQVLKMRFRTRIIEYMLIGHWVRSDWGHSKAMSYQLFFVFKI